VATGKGVFFARVDLENASRPDSVVWTSLSDRLPAAAATDVRLDPAGVQLYVALDGHGVYAAAAPHRLRNLRIVNAADFSTRAAAAIWIIRCWRPPMPNPRSRFPSKPSARTWRWPSRPMPGA
jgi:hypothetical protein